MDLDKGNIKETYQCMVSLSPSEDFAEITSTMKRGTGYLNKSKPLYTSTSFYLITNTALGLRYSIISILRRRAPRFREVKYLVSGHTARR